MPYLNVLRWLVYGSMLSVSGLPLRAASYPVSSPEAVVPFRLARGYAVIVPVTVNGSGPYSFLLDTGSTNTTIDMQLAKELQLAAREVDKITTVAGRQAVSVARAHSVTVGPVTMADVEVLVRDLPALQSLDRSLRGVLGQDAMTRSDYLLDYRHHVIRFDSNGEMLRSIEGERTPLIWRSMSGDGKYGLQMMRTALGDDRSAQRKLVLDSGSASLVLFGQTPLQRASSIPGRLRDDSGGRIEADVMNVKLWIGKIGWELPAHATTATGVGLEGMDGLLPTSLFSSLYVANNEGFVVLSPKWKKGRASTEYLGSVENSTVVK